jgi:hypothetical protein
MLAAANIMGGADRHDPHNHSAHCPAGATTAARVFGRPRHFQGQAAATTRAWTPPWRPRPSRGVGLQGSCGARLWGR